MRDQLQDHSPDPFHPCADETNCDRKLLDTIFETGTQARRNGAKVSDNPYAAGSEERDEWAAGWSASVDFDPGEEPNSGYEKN